MEWLAVKLFKKKKGPKEPLERQQRGFSETSTDQPSPPHMASGEHLWGWLKWQQKLAPPSHHCHGKQQQRQSEIPLIPSI